MAHIASDFTSVFCADAGIIFGTTDLYELGFSYLSICIFTVTETLSHTIFDPPSLFISLLTVIHIPCGQIFETFDPIPT